MVDAVAAVVSECVYVYASCGACNNGVSEQKVMVDAVVEVVNVVIVLLAQLIPQLLPL
ncbi:hypothetical protein [Mucilaginibacter sp. L196]|uniref:hypothetical protein n=1 Tax=Mucilaginibacter sp. L196 TaxID=1641870 RepID=UPI00131E1CBF|nr:hypothetical protein [Mucilaginibacter sp. L196]